MCPMKNYEIYFKSNCFGNMSCNDYQYGMSIEPVLGAWLECFEVIQNTQLDLSDYFIVF